MKHKSTKSCLPRGKDTTQCCYKQGSINLKQQICTYGEDNCWPMPIHQRFVAGLFCLQLKLH